MPSKRQSLQYLIYMYGHGALSLTTKCTYLLFQLRGINYRQKISAILTQILCLSRPWKLIFLNKASDRLSLFFSSTLLPIHLSLFFSSTLLPIRSIFYVDTCVCVDCPIQWLMFLVWIVPLIEWCFDVLLYAPRAAICLIEQKQKRIINVHYYKILLLLYYY